MSTPLVSCIIPVFNGERFIGEAIHSVRRQTAAVDEIVVVDDGSDDATAQIVRSLGADIVYHRQSNQGATVARRTGAELARGEFFAFLDADDVWHEDKTKRQLGLMQQNPKLGVCTAWMQNFWSADVAGELDSLTSERLTEPQPGVASTAMLRARTYSQVGPLDESLRHRDIQDLMIRMRAAGWEVAIIEEVLVQRRIHDRNVSRNRSDTGEQELLRLAAAALARRRSAQSG